MIMEQKATDFKPTELQIVFAENYIQAYGNVSEASRMILGFRRENFYKWQRNEEGFNEWFQDYIEKRILARHGEWYVILEKYARKGSMPHLDRLFEISKKFIPEKQGGVTVNVYPNRTVIFSEVNDNEEVADAEDLHDQEGKNRLGETFKI